MSASTPNVLVIMTDEERYPPPYEREALAEYRRTRLTARGALARRGVELHRHYAGSTACVPSRATLFTGQYPSLHGVRSTDGLAKSAADPAMGWLDPDEVPTLGDWFRAAGYQTHYRGKWHISHADLQVPGTHDSFLTNTREGEVIDDAVAAYAPRIVSSPSASRAGSGPSPTVPTRPTPAASATGSSPSRSSTCSAPSPTSPTTPSPGWRWRRS